MPEQDYDRLEQFFRKAAAKADVNFNEEDWRKLEARLDTEGIDGAVPKNAGARFATTIIVGALLLASTAIWVSTSYNSVAVDDRQARIVQNDEMEYVEEPAVKDDSRTNPLSVEEENKGELSALSDHERGEPNIDDKLLTEDRGVQTDAVPTTIDSRFENTDNKARQGEAKEASSEINGAGIQEPSLVTREEILTDDGDKSALPAQPLQETQAFDQTRKSPDQSERNKQKAIVELPGAEEEETIEAQAMVQEEHASDNRKHVATPRLSLLLSFAPDFSGTSMTLSSSPGKAFGAMLQYQPFRRWSVSAGVIKNYKQYTGAGEDYHPPKGYWKYYTNGIIPETIDGSCSILEFPVAVQYVPVHTVKGRLSIGIGASSYLMQSESYRYYFAKPNPGAKEGWDSRGSSRFFFNMVNFTIGYERQVVPGLMLGIEPYAKIPLEEIGWSNLKLFSSGVSFTLRYTLVRPSRLSASPRSRGPD